MTMVNEEAICLSSHLSVILYIYIYIYVCDINYITLPYQVELAL